MAGIREVKAAQVNCKRAVSEFSDAQRQADALEAEALKALIRENRLDPGVASYLWVMTGRYHRGISFEIVDCQSALRWNCRR